LSTDCMWMQHKISHSVLCPYVLQTPVKLTDDFARGLIHERHLGFRRDAQLAELSNVQRGGALFFFPGLAVHRRAGKFQGVLAVDLAGSWDALERQLDVDLPGLVVVHSGGGDLAQCDGQLVAKYSTV